MVCFAFLPLFWLQIKLSAITENRKQQLEKNKDMRREYSSGEFSLITGWKIKETNCFLTEIFPFTVNLKRSKLNYAKGGRICQLNQMSTEISTTIPIKGSDKLQANEVKEG